MARATASVLLPSVSLFAASSIRATTSGRLMVTTFAITIPYIITQVLICVFEQKFKRKVSDEFIVPLCRGHHREVHRCGDEAGWWKKTGIDPTAPIVRRSFFVPKSFNYNAIEPQSSTSRPLWFAPAVVVVVPVKFGRV